MAAILDFTDVKNVKEGRGGKEGRREGGKEGRREGGKEGRREGGKGRSEGKVEGKAEGKEGREGGDQAQFFMWIYQFIILQCKE